MKLRCLAIFALLLTTLVSVHRAKTQIRIALSPHLRIGGTIDQTRRV